MSTQVNYLPPSLKETRPLLGAAIVLIAGLAVYSMLPASQPEVPEMRLTKVRTAVGGEELTITSIADATLRLDDVIINRGQCKPWMSAVLSADGSAASPETGLAIALGAMMGQGPQITFPIDLVFGQRAVIETRCNILEVETKTDRRNSKWTWSE